MTKEKQLEMFINSFNFKYFKGEEFTPYWKRKRGGVSNSIPHESLWPNIIPTLCVADTLRDLESVPLIVTSSYRNPAYNMAVGGEKNSYHMRFMALDLLCDNPNKIGHAASLLRKCKFSIPGTNDSFLFKGGIGIYNNFIHIDTRGYNADW